jgi:hypothetical protein
MPGSDMQIENYNSALLDKLNIAPIDGITGTTSQPANLSFQKIDFDHPLFATVFEKNQKQKRSENQSIESPVITISLKRQAGKQARTVIRLGDGTPFLSEHTVGHGKTLFFSVSPVVSWSDFPLKGIFVPLMYRSVIYVSSQRESQMAYMVGDEPVMSLRNIPQNGMDKQYSIVYPDATEEILQPTVQSSTQMFPLKHLTMSGCYELRNGQTTIAVFAVNVDRRESDDRKISSEELSEFWKRLGIEPAAVQSLRPNEQLQSTILQSRFGVELWKYCIGMALLMALVEMLIARDSRKANQQLPT